MKPRPSRKVLPGEAHFRRFHEEAPLPHQSLDDEARLLWVNRAWETALGYRREEVLGRFMSDFLAPGQEAVLRQAFGEFLRRDSMKGVELELRCKDGSRKVVAAHGHIARDDEGRFQGAHCILTDITVRKECYQALRRSEETHRLAMEAAQDGLWDWDVSSGNVYYSPGWGDLLGEKNIRPNYATWEDRLHPADKARVLKALHAHLAGQTTVWREEHRLKSADDGWVWVLGRGRVVKRDQQGNPLRMVGTMKDIDARKHAEQELAEARDIAEQASRAKSRFLSAANHDLRQPLHAMKLLVEALSYQEISPTAGVIVQDMTSTVQSMEGMLSALLDISKLEADVIVPEERDFSLAPLMVQLQRRFRVTAKEVGKHIHMAPSDAILRTDPTLLERILQNFIGNAIDHSTGRNILVGCRRAGARRRIEVWDSGPGIPADQVEKIFEDFYQIGNSARTSSKNLGLGLAVTKRIADLLQLRITVRSIPGKGTVFAVEVPLGRNTDQGFNEPFAAESSSRGGDKCVLLVDDNQDVMNATQALLGLFGHRVLGASCAEEALHLTRQHGHELDVMLIDYRLPNGWDGLRLIRSVRAAVDRELPAILLTGDTSANRLKELHISGVSLFHKPFDPAALQHRIDELTQKEQRAPHRSPR